MNFAERLSTWHKIVLALAALSEVVIVCVCLYVCAGIFFCNEFKVEMYMSYMFMYPTASCDEVNGKLDS